MAAAQLDKFSFNVATLDVNGKVLPANTVLTYTVAVDTVNPPLKTFAVPAAVAAAPVGGVVTVTFEQLGFVPSAGVTYFADVKDAIGATSSDPTGVLSFTYSVVPAAPTGFTVG